MKQPLILKCRTSKLLEKSPTGFLASPLESTFPVGKFEVKDWNEVWDKAREYKAEVDKAGNPTVICYYLEKQAKGQRLFSGHELTMNAINRDLRFSNQEKVTIAS